jgi:hypothetical protein
MPMTSTQRAQARNFLADTGTSSVQNVDLQNATGGTFTLTFNGQTTTPLAFNAGGNVVQNALAALSTVGLGNVTVILNQTTYTVYFVGALDHVAQPMLTIDGSALTGVGVVTTVTQVMAGGATAFSDTDLDNYYDFAASYGTPNFALAVAFCFDELLAGGAKFNDYVAGQSQEKKSQITDHLAERATWWHQWALADRQLQTVRLEGVPPQVRAVPVSSGTPATSLRYSPERSPFRPRGG